MNATPRRSASALRLLRDALGPPRVVPGKVVRLGQIVAGYARGEELDRVLSRLHSLGHIERIPTRVQLAVGSFDMLRFWISPLAADYYRKQNIDYGFHQVLRFLEEPASMADPVGFFSTRDNIIGHLLQVVHANPLYDLQLLERFEDGLDALEAQLEAMLDGTHPRATSIGAVVEEPDYHQRLLSFVRRWRADRTTPPMLRSNIEERPEFARLERVFGSMTTAMRYFCALPDTPRGAFEHARTVTEMPWHLVEN